MLSGRLIDAATEEAQYALYRSLLEQTAPLPVTICTFDLNERQLEGRGARPGLRGLRLGLRGPRFCARNCAPYCVRPRTGACA